MTEKLSPKEQRFCLEYIVDQKGGPAAVRAGYSARSADQIASRLLRKDKVAAKVQELLAEVKKDNLVTLEYVVNTLKEVVERCMTHEPVMEFDHTEKKMVQKMAAKLEDGKLKEVGIFEFDSSGANRALELLGKHIGAFPEKHEVTGKGGDPLMQAPQIDFSGLTTAELKRLARKADASSK